MPVSKFCSSGSVTKLPRTVFFTAALLTLAACSTQVPEIQYPEESVPVIATQEPQPERDLGQLRITVAGTGDIMLGTDFPKNILPDKERVMMSMEELIHHFIVATQGIDAPAGEVYFGAENPKGELGFYINSKGGGVPHRLKIRSPSFCNLSILPELLPGHMISDVPVILGSLDFVMGECDR